MELFLMWIHYLIAIFAVAIIGELIGERLTRSFNSYSYNMKSEELGRCLRFYFASLLLVGLGLLVLFHDWSSLQQVSQTSPLPAYIEFICAHAEVVTFWLAIAFFVSAVVLFVRAICLTVEYVQDYCKFTAKERR